jgi:hypothetical protein
MKTIIISVLVVAALVAAYFFSPWSLRVEGKTKDAAASEVAAEDSKIVEISNKEFDEKLRAAVEAAVEAAQKANPAPSVQVPAVVISPPQVAAEQPQVVRAQPLPPGPSYEGIDYFFTSHGDQMVLLREGGRGFGLSWPEPTQEIKKPSGWEAAKWRRNERGDWALAR